MSHKKRTPSPYGRKRIMSPVYPTADPAFVMGKRPTGDTSALEVQGYALVVKGQRAMRFAKHDRQRAIDLRDMIRKGHPKLNVRVKTIYGHSPPEPLTEHAKPKLTARQRRTAELRRLRLGK